MTYESVLGVFHVKMAAPTEIPFQNPKIFLRPSYAFNHTVTYVSPFNILLSLVIQNHFNSISNYPVEM